MQNIAGLFSEVCEFFRLTQEAADVSECEAVRLYRCQDLPGFLFRFELYEAEEEIRFILQPEGQYWRTLYAFGSGLNHWSGEHMNMAIAGAMRSIREMHRLHC